MNPTPQILIVDDVPANLQVLSLALEQAHYEVLVATSGAAALESVSLHAPDLILLDVRMPDMDGYETCRRLKQDSTMASIPVIFLTAQQGSDDVVAGFRSGGVDFVSKPFEAEEVLARVNTHLKLARLTRELEEQNERLRQEIEARQASDARLDRISAQEAARIDGFVGNSPSIAGLLDEVRRLQDAPMSVLIQGESGTGKELIARALHYGGPRSRGPFVPVNSSAISNELAESQLFGHVRGAFTGADRDHRGFFEQSDGGTLFLDEIGDMPPDIQAKVLRALEEGVVRPVGATQERRVDTRVVAATHVDLSGRMTAGTFRRDLFFRLAHFTLTVPPLRERMEDIELLASHFLQQLAVEMGRAVPQLAPDSLQALHAYAFPGNVRELRNMLEYSLLKCGDIVEARHLHFLDLPKSAASHEDHVDPATMPRLRPPDPDDQLLNYARQHGSISNTECRQLLDVDSRRATYLLDKLCTAGQMRKVGARRYARYLLAD